MYFFKDNITSSRLAIVYSEDKKNRKMRITTHRLILFFIKTSPHFLSLAKIIKPDMIVIIIPILSVAVDINIEKNARHMAYPHIFSFIL